MTRLTATSARILANDMEARGIAARTRPTEDGKASCIEAGLHHSRILYYDHDVASYIAGWMEGRADQRDESHLA